LGYFLDSPIADGEIIYDRKDRMVKLFRPAKNAREKHSGKGGSGR